jgi:glyoxylase-like metal-dependent hydrolase (beta-lactamase superfamily II)
MGESGIDSRHFDLQPLAEGVLAAIATFGQSAVCNAGIIDLGGQTLVFDTFLTPQAATDLRQAITHRLGPARCLVVNSHYHNDHTWGNQAFADVPILASRRTRALMATAGAEELEWYSANSAARLESLRASYQKADGSQQQEALLWIGEYAGIVEALPDLKVCLPTITFDDRLEIHGSRYSAELLSYEGAHTGHDTALVLPQAGIVFAGDLLFVGCHPYLGDGDPWGLLQALRSLLQLQAAWYVPGHGPVGTVDDVRRLIEYVEHCLATASELLAGEQPAEARVAEIEIPERYAPWWVPSFYRANLRFLCERLSSPAAGE